MGTDFKFIKVKIVGHRPAFKISCKNSLRVLKGDTKLELYELK